MSQDHEEELGDQRAEARVVGAGRAPREVAGCRHGGGDQAEPRDR